MKILNRIVEWTPQGIAIEGDQRRSELIGRDMVLDGKSKSVSTPTDVNGNEEDETFSRDGWRLLHWKQFKSLYSTNFSSLESFFSNSIEFPLVVTGPVSQPCVFNNNVFMVYKIAGFNSPSIRE